MRGTPHRLRELDARKPAAAADPADPADPAADPAAADPAADSAAAADPADPAAFVERTSHPHSTLEMRCS